jgi:RNA polymerase-binding protein DksA
MAKVRKTTKTGSKPPKQTKAAKARPVAKKTVAPPPPKSKASKPEPQKPASKKASFSKQELEYFRTIITEKKKETLDELSVMRDAMMDPTTGEYVSENSTYSTHMEQGTDAMEREKMYLFASREGKFLNYLEDALKRIDKGEYGRCTECGKLIEKERLEAVPHAQQCLQCKLRLNK